MLREIDHHFLAQESFAFETTLSGRSYQPSGCVREGTMLPKT